MTTLATVIGSALSEHVAIDVTHRELPASTDYWDGNWGHASVRICVGAFRGEHDRDSGVGRALSIA